MTGSPSTASRQLLDRGSMTDLYDSDVVAWAERQAELLRRRAAGELVNDAELDWENVAEEIEDVSKSQLRAVASHLVQALLHGLKAPQGRWPEAASLSCWKSAGTSRSRPCGPM